VDDIWLSCSTESFSGRILVLINLPVSMQCIARNRFSPICNTCQADCSTEATYFHFPYCVLTTNCPNITSTYFSFIFLFSSFSHGDAKNNWLLMMDTQLFWSFQSIGSLQTSCCIYSRVVGKETIADTWNIIALFKATWLNTLEYAVCMQMTRWM